MLRGSRSPNASSGVTGCSPRSRCLGFISPRTATLLLAMLGFIAHLQTFRHLAVLHDSFPHVPKTRSLSTSRPFDAPPVADVAEVYDPAFARIPDETIYDASTKSTSLSSASIDAASVADSIAPTTTTTSVMTKEDVLAMVKPTRWFNMLPKRPWGEDSKTTAEDAAVWRAQQADQEEERRSWETARRLTQIMRVYALCSAAASALGVYGVLKSDLFATRIFAMSSFVDVFLFAFSVVSVCIIITYPEIRSMLCEQISSGELHAFLSYIHGANHSSATATIADVDVAAAAAAEIAVRPGVASAGATSSSSALPAARLLSYATGPFWKRALTGSQDSNNSMLHIYWWDTLIDDMLENESCDDIFVSVLVPLGLLFCFAYLVLRIHFLFVIRGHYTALLRERGAFYLSSAGSVKCTSSSSSRNAHTLPTMSLATNDGRLNPIDEKPTRKYSSSSSSSSTVVELGSSRNNSKWAAEKALGEKMA